MKDPTLPPGGILRLPVRSGKTLTSALIAHHLGLRVLFVAPSEYLLRQAKAAYKSYLADVTVGQFGLGVKETDKDVLIATVQTLVRSVRTKEFEKLRRQGRLLVFDEVHHNASDAVKWYDAVMRLEPPVTLGLSATFELDDHDDPEEATSAIRLRGMCGPIRHDVQILDLVNLGLLVRPTVHWIETNAPAMPKRAMTPQQIYKLGIAECDARNAKIIDATCEYVSDGHLVLVDAARVGHTRALARGLKRKLGARVGMMVGSTKVPMREKLVRSFRDRKTRVLVSTVLGEGADIPELDVVVNAEGGSGYVPTMQRFRCMTAAPGKDAAYLVDFVDDHHKALLDATRARQRVYKAAAFKFRTP